MTLKKLTHLLLSSSPTSLSLSGTSPSSPLLDELQSRSGVEASSCMKATLGAAKSYPPTILATSSVTTPSEQLQSMTCDESYESVLPPWQQRLPGFSRFDLPSPKPSSPSANSERKSKPRPLPSQLILKLVQGILPASDSPPIKRKPSASR